MRAHVREILHVCASHTRWRTQTMPCSVSVCQVGKHLVAAQPRGGSQLPGQRHAQGVLQVQDALAPQAAVAVLLAQVAQHGHVSHSRRGRDAQLQAEAVAIIAKAPATGGVLELSIGQVRAEQLRTSWRPLVP